MRRYRPLPDACEGCHADPHRGSFRAFAPSPGAAARPAVPAPAAAVARAKVDLSPRPPDPAGGATRCAACHTTEDWRRGAFAHDRTGFPLEGAHAAAECSGCHARGTLSRAVPRACAACHGDVHAGRLGGRCERCHEATAWRNVTFDADAHRRGAFPLTGRHAFTPCDSCHGDRRDRGFTRPTRQCVACHRADLARASSAAAAVDHALAGFPETCQVCHTAWSFSPAAFPAHDACFRLAPGPHAGIRCQDCHTSVPAVSPPFACLTDTADCIRCHSCAEHEPVSGFAYANRKCYLAARAERWVPSANPRFRPGDDARLYVWQAQLTAPLSRATLMAGRLLPYAIPGATILDGASASFRAGPAELGLFGGLVPQPDTLSPTAERATGGGFWSVSHTLGSGAGVRQSGRLAVVRSPELGTRLEATLGGAAWWRAAYLSAEARLGAGGEAQAAGALDAARVDVTARVAPGLSVGGGFRHEGLEWPAPAGLLEPARFPGRSEAAEGWAAWEVGFLRLGASGGFSRDRTSRLDRSWAGPEIGVPRLLGGRLGLSAGYLEERGWLEGRSAWGQAAFRTGARLGLSLRGTWTHDSKAAIDADEVGLLAALSWDLGRGLGLRAAVLARTVAATGEGGGSTPLGITGSAALRASY